MEFDINPYDGLIFHLLFQKNTSFILCTTFYYLMNMIILRVAFKYATDMAQPTSEKYRYARNLVKHVSSLNQTEHV